MQKLHRLPLRRGQLCQGVRQRGREAGAELGLRGLGSDGLRADGVPDPGAVACSYAPTDKATSGRRDSLQLRARALASKTTEAHRSRCSDELP